MDSSTPSKRRRGRPLLVAGAGLAVIAVASCGPVGNLRALPYPDGGFDRGADTGGSHLDAGADAGAADAGADAGAASDGGGGDAAGGAAG